MSVIGQTSYSARVRPEGDGIGITQGLTTITDWREAADWLSLLDPWLRRGDPRGSAYLNFGSQAAFIRWRPDARKALPWEQALALTGPSARLTGPYALELPPLPRAGTLHTSRIPPADGTPGPRHHAIEHRARSADAVTALVPVLADVLYGKPRVTMPQVDLGLAEAVLWGLLTILEMMGYTRPVSFLTRASGAGGDADLPGPLVSFRANAAEPMPDPGYAALAVGLARRFADDPAGLRQWLAERGVAAAADDSDRIRLLSSPAGRPPKNAGHGGTATAAASFGEPVARTDQPADQATPTMPAMPAASSAPAPSPAPTAPTVSPAPTASPTPTVLATPTMPATPTVPAMPAMSPAPARLAAPGVMCPMCLGDIPNWGALDYWRWNAAAGEYEQIRIPPDLNPTQRARFTHGAFVRCPAAGDEPEVAHYLPARYGRFGEPVLLGFVGLTQSGKTHLLASMIAEISGLSEYGIDVTELDRATHHKFVDNSVKPLIAGHRVLPGTPDDATTTLADAFIVRQGKGPERVVALFDVSGGNLARTEGDKTVEFLWIADGLFFVIDPDHIGASRVGDETFDNVLAILTGARPKPEPASAAIILNKADKARFDEPVARWLRAGNGALEPTEFLRESADVYAYLEQHRATALTRPYQACKKATFHVASPTGGAQDTEDRDAAFPRGVTPLRVLRPLVAMLAMTGVLTGPQAEQIGV